MFLIEKKPSLGWTRKKIKPIDKIITDERTYEAKFISSKQVDVYIVLEEKQTRTKTLENIYNWLNKDEYKCHNKFSKINKNDYKPNVHLQSE